MQVGGEPAQGTVWHTQLNTSYASEYVTNNNGADVLEANLDVGSHTVGIFLREDGTRLDRIGLERVGAPAPTTAPTTVPTPIATGQPTAVPTITATPAAPTPVATSLPSGCGGLVMEAEAGELSGFFTVTNSDADSGGAYIHVPDGSGNRGTQIDAAHKTRLCFTLAEPGTYRIKGRVHAEDQFNNSFYVQVDNNPANGYLWHTQTSNDFADQYVTNLNGLDIVEFELSAGEHKVDIFLREDGTRLDKLALEPIDASTEVAAASIDTISANWLFGTLSLNAPNRSWLHSDTAALGNAQVVLTALSTNGNRYRQRTTVDLDGGYYFDQVPDGQYQLSMILPGGFEAVGADFATIQISTDEVIERQFGIDAAEVDGASKEFIFLPFVR